MALACRDELVRYGISVGMSRERDEEDRLAEEIAECNAFAPDCAVEIHNNAGCGDGFEAFCQTNGNAALSRTLADFCEEEVKKLGQNSRGVKTKKNQSGTDWFGWLRCCKCPAVLLEGAFLDNRTDVQIIDTAEKQQAFGRAYAKAILRYLGIAENPDTGADEKTVQEEIDRLKAEYSTLEACVQAFRARILEAVNVFDSGKGEK